MLSYLVSTTLLFFYNGVTINSLNFYSSPNLIFRDPFLPYTLASWLFICKDAVLTVSFLLIIELSFYFVDMLFTYETKFLI